MIRGISVFFAVVFLTAAVATAQQPPAGGAPGGGPQAAPPPPANLQVLPKDIPRQQLLATMQGFAGALGVRCEYCHVEEGAVRDMASDDKATKRAARQMMLLVRDINAKVPAAVGKTETAATRVECVTCHRGVAIPKQIGDIMTETVAASGLPAAVTKYRDLRKQYYGAMAYDFSEGGLITIANRVAMAKPDEALQWLELNLEFNPQSARSYVAMAQIQNRTGDKPGAIKSVEKAIEIDPSNAMAKMLLETLRK